MAAPRDARSHWGVRLTSLRWPSRELTKVATVAQLAAPRGARVTIRIWIRRHSAGTLSIPGTTAGLSRERAREEGGRRIEKGKARRKGARGGAGGRAGVRAGARAGARAGERANKRAGARAGERAGGRPGRAGGLRKTSKTAS